jgi:hypothetical protein
MRHGAMNVLCALACKKLCGNYSKRFDFGAKVSSVWSRKDHSDE